MEQSKKRGIGGAPAAADRARKEGKEPCGGGDNHRFAPEDCSLSSLGFLGEIVVCVFFLQVWDH